MCFFFEFRGRTTSDWRAILIDSRAARRGIWHAGTDIETPEEYKKRHRAAQEAAHDEEPEAELEVFEPEPERKGILNRILRRGKSGNAS